MAVNTQASRASPQKQWCLTKMLFKPSRGSHDHIKHTDGSCSHVTRIPWPILFLFPPFPELRMNTSSLSSIPDLTSSPPKKHIKGGGFSRLFLFHHYSGLKPLALPPFSRFSEIISVLFQFQGCFTILPIDCLANAGSQFQVPPRYSMNPVLDA